MRSFSNSWSSRLRPETPIRQAILGAFNSSRPSSLARLGAAGREIEQIGRAALLHDVGKIYEKYAGVLSKQDKLTPEEWAIIQEHPADGANLVATMTRLRDLVPSVRHHHENWDGTGYPDRIAAGAIPLAARIIRFADTIDAMTTDRPYRRPLTEAQVRAEVLRCRGTNSIRNRGQVARESAVANVVRSGQQRAKYRAGCRQPNAG